MIAEIFNVQFHATPDERTFLLQECVRMDREEPITNSWTPEAILEARLQIDIDRSRGVDEAPKSELLKACELVLAALNKHTTRTGEIIWIDESAVHESANERLLAVIAKAKGVE